MTAMLQTSGVAQFAIITPHSGRLDPLRRRALDRLRVAKRRAGDLDRVEPAAEPGWYRAGKSLFPLPRRPDPLSPHQCLSGLADGALGANPD
jgi:hypothetical protein